MSGKPARSLLAVAVGLAGLAALPQASPVGAQNAETVTRTLESGVEVEMPAGKFYTVVDSKTGERSGAVREGDLIEFTLLFGEATDVSDPPELTCSTIDGTARQADNDFVGGDFPVRGVSSMNQSVTKVTLPVLTKTEFQASPLRVNVYDPSEYFSVLCLTDAGSRDWTPWRASLFHITILDQVEPETPPTVTDPPNVASVSTGPVIMAPVPEGKFYSLTFHNGGDGTVDAEGRIVEGDLGEFVLARGQQTGEDVTFTCTTSDGTADESDYVGGSFPGTAFAGTGGFTLPLVTKHDTVVELDEYFWIECMPTSGDDMFDWRVWGSPRARIRLVDDTTEVRFHETGVTIEEGATGTVSVIADGKGARAKGTRNSTVSAVVSFFDEGTGALHPEDVRFSGTQAASMTHALGGTSIEPQAITLQAVDNSVCEGPKIGIVDVSSPSASDWASAGAILGGLQRAYLRIVDDEDAPSAPPAVAADVNGSNLAVEWLEPSCPYLKGVEMEYQTVGAASWTSGLKAGRQWDYDGDGDPSNNAALTMSHTAAGVAAGAEYNVRVRYHNDGGAGAWRQVLSGTTAIVRTTSPSSSGGGPVAPPLGGGTFTPPPTTPTGGGDPPPDSSDTGEGDEPPDPPPAPESPRYTISVRDPACEPNAGLENFPFADVAETSYARGDVGCLTALEVTTGTSPTTYSPAREVTRAQMASFLARLFGSVTGEQAPVGQTPFTDVAAGSTHAADVARLYGLGITPGAGATAYFPDQTVDRARMASFLAGLYEVVTGAPAPVVETPFTDLPADSAAADDVARIYGFGITTGTDATTYSPDLPVNREQMASFLARLYRVLTE